MTVLLTELRRQATQTGTGPPGSGNGPEMVRDPVCGTIVARREAHSSLFHGRERYFFCSSACQERFEWWPARYLRPRGQHVA